MKTHVTLLLLANLFSLFGVVAGAKADEPANWQLKLAQEPLSERTACLMVSAVKHTEDGQTETPVTIIYNGKAFFVKTKSNIDLSYPNIGLQVGHHKPHTIDRVYKDTNVVFETGAEQIRDEFIKGLSVRVTLGFWPTWPKTKSYSVEFGLRGFTKTYKAFRICQSTGELP